MTESSTGVLTPCPGAAIPRHSAPRRVESSIRVSLFAPPASFATRREPFTLVSLRSMLFSSSERFVSSSVALRITPDPLTLMLPWTPSIRALSATNFLASRPTIPIRVSRAPAIERVSIVA